jgi:anthranilate synthase component 2
VILIIDNYDSFSYNLYQLVGALAGKDVPEPLVARNDALGLADVARMRPSHIIISPGPGRPAGAGVCEELVSFFGGKIPILGVCLGHQAICEAYGAAVGYAKSLMHGKASRIRLDPGCPLFAGLPEYIEGARYHSLAAIEPTIPPCLAVCARSGDGEVMAVRHTGYPVYGLQFHPESILTPKGKAIVENFLAIGMDNIR